jgi:hypothetical protein
VFKYVLIALSAIAVSLPIQAVSVPGPPKGVNFEIVNKLPKPIWVVILSDWYGWLPASTLKAQKDIAEGQAGAQGAVAGAGLITDAGKSVGGLGGPTPWFMASYNVFKTGYVSIPGTQYLGANNGKTSYAKPQKVLPGKAYETEIRLDRDPMLVIYEQEPKAVKGDQVAVSFDLAYTGMKGTRWDPVPATCYNFVTVFQDPKIVADTKTNKKGYLTYLKTVFVDYENGALSAQSGKRNILTKVTKGPSGKILDTNVGPKEILRTKCGSFNSLQEAAPLNAADTDAQTLLGGKGKASDLKTATPLKPGAPNPQTLMGGNGKASDLKTAAPLKPGSPNPQTLIGANKKASDLKTAAPLKPGAPNPQTLIGANKKASDLNTAAPLKPDTMRPQMLLSADKRISDLKALESELATVQARIKTKGDPLTAVISRLAGLIQNLSKPGADLKAIRDMATKMIGVAAVKNAPAQSPGAAVLKLGQHIADAAK